MKVYRVLSIVLIVGLLVIAGWGWAASVASQSKYGSTPLMEAAKYGHVQTLSILIKAGADVNAADGRGVTPLWLAAQNGHVETVTILIEAGADVNVRPRYR